MLSWTLAGSNRFFLIFVSFDQAKERRKEEESLIRSPSPKEKGVLIQVKRIIISSYYSSTPYCTIQQVQCKCFN
jgi:hypothetical protein